MKISSVIKSLAYIVQHIRHRVKRLHQQRCTCTRCSGRGQYIQPLRRGGFVRGVCPVCEGDGWLPASWANQQPVEAVAEMAPILI